jgi:hypothetical protein
MRGWKTSWLSDLSIAWLPEHLDSQVRTVCNTIFSWQLRDCCC